MSLILERVSKRYGRETALEGVDIALERGDCYGFIGHNGAGKTTAMRIALGLVRPSSGRVLIDGFDVAKAPAEGRTRAGALIERPGFFDDLDGRRNLMRLARLQGLGARESADEVARLLELVGLAGAARKAVGHYSQGMRQRLGIAQALLGRPDYVLLDEPGNGLDPEGLAEMRALIRRLTRDEGLTVLLSSHQLDEVARLCNRIGVLKRGRLVLEEESAAVFERAAPRWRLETEQVDLAARVLDGAGVEVVAREPGALTFEGRGDAAALSRALFEKGVALRSFAREEPSLESIYLQLDAAAAPRPAQPRPIEPRGARRAPGLAVLRALRYEAGRLFGGLGAWFLLLLPAGVAAYFTWSFAVRDEERMRRMVEEGQFAEATSAFPAVAEGLGPALPLLVLAASLLASQSLAGELARGTLRNAVLRPVRRWQLALGKLVAVFGWTLAGYLILAGVTLAVAGAMLDFQGLAEILPNGERFETVPAETLMPELRRALVSPIAALIGYAALGFLCGALARNGVVALSMALGAWLVLALAQQTVADPDTLGWLLSTHVPSPFGSRSYVLRYDQLARGASNAVEAMVDRMHLAPAVWATVAGALAVFRFSRRSIP